MLVFDYAIESSTGNVRKSNQDSGYAGQNLILVADGMGGHKGGDTASQIAISHISQLDEEHPNSDDAVRGLKNAVFNAQKELVLAAQKNKKLSGFGTTITALLKSNNSLILGHIGDSRAYVLSKTDNENNNFTQITKDHTYVQYLVDNAQISEKDAESHPKKSLLLRVLSDVDFDQNIDISIRSATPGDRYMLCSDGLSGLVSVETIKKVLTTSRTPKIAVNNLINLALAAGGTDNITCIVADIVDEDEIKEASVEAEVAGAIATDMNDTSMEIKKNIKKKNSFFSRIFKNKNKKQSKYIPWSIENKEKAIQQKRRRLRAIMASTIIGLILFFTGGGIYFSKWLKSQYYIGTNNNNIVVMQGINQTLGPINLYKEVVVTSYSDKILPEYVRVQLKKGIKIDNLSQADSIITNYILSAK